MQLKRPSNRAPVGVSGALIFSGVAGILLPIGLPYAADDVVMGYPVVGKPEIKPEDIDWYSLIDMVWHGMTVPDACKEMGYQFQDVYKHMGLERRKYFVEVSMMASVKKEYLEDEGGC